MIISNDLFFNIVKDWEKRDVSTAEKGKFIQEYLSEKNISQRELARQLNISHSTLHDWISGRQMEKYYESKKNELFFCADKIVLLLKSNPVVDDKTRRKLRELKRELDKFDVIDLDGSMY